MEVCLLYRWVSTGTSCMFVFFIDKLRQGDLACLCYLQRSYYRHILEVCFLDRELLQAHFASFLLFNGVTTGTFCMFVLFIEELLQAHLACLSSLQRSCYRYILLFCLVYRRVTTGTSCLCVYFIGEWLEAHLTSLSFFWRSYYRQVVILQVCLFIKMWLRTNLASLSSL